MAAQSESHQETGVFYLQRTRKGGVRKLIRHDSQHITKQFVVAESLGLLNVIQAESMYFALLDNFSPAATPLWNSGHLSMLGTTSMWSISTVVPRGGARPLRQRRGMCWRSVSSGDPENSVRAPWNEMIHGISNNRDDKTHPTTDLFPD